MIDNDFYNNPAVSIIVPVFNGEKYISKCVESLISQNYKNIEIIIVNDGSSDRTEEILDEFKTRDPRVHIYNVDNGGVSKARNYGIDKSIGDYIMFVDGDDYIDISYVKKYLDDLSDEDFVIGGYCHFFEKNGNIADYKCKNQLYTITTFLNDANFFLSPPFLLGPCFKLFKSSIIKYNNIRFPEDLAYGEDAEFVFNYLNYCLKIKSIEYSGYYYRRHSKETLSTKYLDNKMSIFYRLSNDLKKLFVSKNINNHEDIVNDMFARDFILFCHELIASRSSFWRTRKVFFKNANEYNIKTILKAKKKKSLAIRCVLFSIRSHFFLITFVLFRINDMKYN